MAYFEGGRVPLFYRLVDEAPGTRRQEVEPLRVLDEEALRESVKTELVELFQTRGVESARYDDPRPLSVLEYGIPELSKFTGRDSALRTVYEAQLTRIIGAFEPRLNLSSLRLEPVQGAPEVASVHLEGHLITSWVEVQVSFDFDLKLSGGQTREGTL